MPEDFNHFDEIANALPKVYSQIVRKTAFDLQSQAASLAPVDTGFLRNSIYVKTSSDSSYGQVAAPTHKTSYALSEVDTPPDDQTAYVAVGANYGVDVEIGTHRQAPQPFLAPAADYMQPIFEEACSAIENKLKNPPGDNE